MNRVKILFLSLLALIGVLSFSSVDSFSLPFAIVSKNTLAREVKVGNPSDEVVVNVVQRAIPSVVTIALTHNIQDSSIEEDSENVGSGFIISDEGLIVTNKHVVSEPEVAYSVITNTKTYAVQKIYRDPLNDIAILKINASKNELKTIPLGDSSKLQVGQLAIAIGTPLGEFNNTVTTGVVSGLGRGITAGDPYEGLAERLDNLIQTDAAINSGNSGGPLLNSAGEVIGVNTAASNEGQNISFALPINAIKNSLENFNDTGQFERPYLGVSYRMAEESNSQKGAHIQQVLSGSPAAKGGIQVGDVIVSIDGQDLQEKNQEIASFIAKKKIGDTVKLTFVRGNSSQEVSVKLEKAPQE